MKSIGQKNEPSGANNREIARHPNKSEEIRSDPPLSEKDEVKQAENRLRKSVKKHS